MSADLHCYRCGASLAALTPPISRQDQCPDCTVYLHVCRMCRYFDPRVPQQCREDDAEEVTEKERLNFCDWYEPSADAYDGARAASEQQAKSQLSALFGAGDAEVDDDDSLRRQADELFK